MTKKTSPLSDESITAQATLLTMLDDLESGVDVIEACKNAAQRAEAITALRVMIEEVRQAHRLTSDIRFISTHVRGQNSLSEQARNARLLPSKELDKYLENNWFSLAKKPRQDAFVQKHYPIFCKKVYDTDTGENINNKKIKKIGVKQFKKRLSPSQRRKPVAP